MCEICNIIFSRSKNCSIVPKSRGWGMTIFFLHGGWVIQEEGCSRAREILLYREEAAPLGRDSKI